MALTFKELEEKWPEGPAFAFEAARQRLLDFDPAVACASKQAESPMCFELRLAMIGLFGVAVEEVKVARAAKNLNPRSWLMASRPVSSFAQIVLAGVR